MAELQDNNYNAKPKKPIPWAVILSILFPLGGIYYFVMYQFIFKPRRVSPSELKPGKLPSTDIYMISILIMLPFILIAFFIPNILTLYLAISFLFGGIATISTILGDIRRLKHFPWLREMTGTWFYQYQSPLSIRQRMINKSSRKVLSDPNYYDDEARVLGIVNDTIRTDKDDFEDPTKIVKILYKDAVKHTIAVGRSGSGKSVTMLNMCRQDIHNNNPIIFFDMKKSMDVVYFLSKLAYENDRKFYHFVAGRPGTYSNMYADNQSTWDPLAFGSVQAKTTVVLSMRDWSGADHFKQVTTNILSTIFNIFEVLPEEELRIQGIDCNHGGVAQLMSALNSERFKNLANGFKSYVESHPEVSVPEAVKQNVDSLRVNLSGHAASTKSISDQFTQISLLVVNLMNSSYGHWLSPGTSENHINLLKVLTDTSNPNPPIVLFSMSVAEEGGYAKSVGNMALNDLQRAIALKRISKGAARSMPVSIYLDEVQSLDISILQDIFAKARDVNCAVTVSMQSLAQIQEEWGPDMVKAIVSPCNNYIAQGALAPDDAKIFADTASKRRKPKYKLKTMRVSHWASTKSALESSPETTTTEENVYIIEPSVLEQLEGPIELCYIAIANSDSDFNGRGHTALVCHTVVPDELISPIPTEFSDDYNSMYDNPIQDEDILISPISYNQNNNEIYGDEAANIVKLTDEEPEYPGGGLPDLRDNIITDTEDGVPVYSPKIDINIESSSLGKRTGRSRIPKSNYRVQ